MKLRQVIGIISVIVPLSAFTLIAQQGNQPAPARSAKATAVKPVGQQQDEGERIFEQQCSRCHTSPDGFSARISGTIVRHMRVRASLSKHEEEELLRFFNP